MRARLRREDGAAAVEFALIVGVLVLLIFGMLQFGLAFFQIQNLRAAAREGARLGAVGATGSAIRDRVADASAGSITRAEAGGVFLTVEYSDTGADPWTAVADGNVACRSSAPVTTNAGVRVRMAIDGTAPQSLQDIFTLDIPLMPTMTLTPTVSGQFRCEGVKST